MTDGYSCLEPLWSGMGKVALASMISTEFLTLKVLVTTVDALGHFEIG